MTNLHIYWTNHVRHHLDVHWPVWLVFSAFLLLPVGRAVELPTLIMAIAGLVALTRHGNAIFTNHEQRLFALMFLCIWVPMVISLADAANSAKSIRVVLSFARLYLAGVFVIWALAKPGHLNLVIKLVSAMLVFWVFDALVQALSGQDLFGFDHTPPRLNGVYGEQHMDLGVALPTLAPLIVYFFRNSLAAMGLVTLLTGVVVVLAGSRGGWVSFGLTITVLAFHELRRRSLTWRHIGIAFLLLAGTVAALVGWAPETQARIRQTMLLFSNDWHQMNQATAYRLQIWDTSYRMFTVHPITGVGVGGFRYAYPAHAQPGDIFIDPQAGTGPFYAHQIIVQVGTETGLIGLTGLALFYGIWLRAWRRSNPEQKAASLPFALASLAWLFPANTHASFYSSQWSQLIWLLLSLYCASLSKPLTARGTSCPT